MQDFILILLEMTIAGNITFLVVKSIRHIMQNKMSSILYYQLLKGCLLCYLTPAYFLQMLALDRGERKFHCYVSILIFNIGIVLYIRRKTKKQKWYIDILNHTSYPCTHKALEKCMMEIKREYHIPMNHTIQVWMNDYISSPMLAGIGKSAIYLPNVSLSEEELRYVLSHEMVHYIQKDLIMARVLNFLKVMLPCDPIVHIYIKELFNWGECSVEEKMYQKSRVFDRRQYARVLQKFLVENRVENCYQVHMSDGDLKGFKIRLEQMKNHEKREKRADMFAMLIAICAVPIVIFVAVHITIRLGSYFI